MKKSDAIKQAQKILLSLPRELERGIKLSANDRHMITLLLLGEFEKLGMQPPWYTPKNQPFTDPNDKKGEWSSFNEIHDWEPESSLSESLNTLINEEGWDDVENNADGVKSRRK